MDTWGEHENSLHVPLKSRACDLLRGGNTTVNQQLHNADSSFSFQIKYF